MNEPDRSRSMILNLVVLITLTLAPGTLPAGEVIVTAEVARLLARDGATFDEFGASVSLDGDRVAVASYVDDNDIGFVAGSVYIFERNEDGSWSVVAKILPLSMGWNSSISDFLSLSMATGSLWVPTEAVTTDLIPARPTSST